jgi:hypothetical protein
MPLSSIAALAVLIVGVMGWVTYSRFHATIASQRLNPAAVVQPEKGIVDTGEPNKKHPLTINTESKVPTGTQIETVRQKIIKELPVGVDEIAQSIRASAILSSDAPVHVSRMQNVITVDTNRYQASEKDLKADALLVAQQTIKVEPKTSFLRVVFHNPENQAAYDEVMIDRGQLAMLADGILNDQKLLSGIKVVVSKAARTRESPAPEPALIKSIALPQSSRPPLPGFPPGRPPDFRGWRQGPVNLDQQAVSPLVAALPQDQLKLANTARLPLGASNQAGRSSLVRTLSLLIPEQNPVYIDQLAQAFQAAGLNVPLLGMERYRRLRLAVHIISMYQNGQNIGDAKYAYAIIESDLAQGNVWTVDRLLREQETVLRLPRSSADTAKAHILDELRKLRWPVILSKRPTYMGLPIFGIR